MAIHESEIWVELKKIMTMMKFRCRLVAVPLPLLCRVKCAGNGAALGENGKNLHFNYVISQSLKSQIRRKIE